MNPTCDEICAESVAKSVTKSAADSQSNREVSPTNDQIERVQVIEEEIKPVLARVRKSRGASEHLPSKGHLADDRALGRVKV